MCIVFTVSVSPVLSHMGLFLKFPENFLFVKLLMIVYVWCCVAQIILILLAALVHRSLETGKSMSL